MSKLGPHFMAGGDVTAWARIGASIYKFDPMTLGASDIIPPGPLVVGKLDQQDDALGLSDWKAMGRNGSSPAEVARKRFEAQRMIPGPRGSLVNRYTSNQRIDVWEDDNEVVPDNAGEARWYSDYCIEMMKRYENIGKRRANFSFAVGTPDIRPGDENDIWPYLLPAVRYARDNGHYLALHEYMGYAGEFGVGWQQIDAKHIPLKVWHGRRVGNVPDERYPYGWTALRYRYVYDKYLQPVGLNDTLLIITELGCDSVESVTPLGLPTGTWRELATHWQAHGLDPDERYADMLIWYDTMIGKDRFVVGATIFTVGSVGIWKKWDIANEIVESYILTHIGTTRGSTPLPMPEQEKPMDNLLRNPSFDSPAWRDAPWGQHPAEWELIWNEGTAYDDQRYMIGEARHLNRGLLPSSEHALFFLDPFDKGDGNTYKIFGGGKPIWARLKQTLVARPGRYRLTVPVYVDCYKWDNAAKRKDYASVDPKQVEAMIRVDDADVLPWKFLKTGERHDLVVEFDHEDDPLDIAIHFRANWGISNNFWVDGLSLVEIPVAEVPLPPPPPPPAKHKAIVVKLPQGATEEQWLIAAQYCHQFQHTLTASLDDSLTVLAGGNDLSYVKLLWPALEAHGDTAARLRAAGYRVEEINLPAGLRTNTFTSPIGPESERESGELW